MAEKGALSINMDSLLDGTLDDLKDMPEFKPFPIGVHHCSIKWEREENTMKLHVTAIETKELANSTDTPLEKGTETTCQYKLDNEYGQGAFKELLKCLRGIHGEDKTNRQLLDVSNGGEYLLVTDQRKNKKDKDNIQIYTDVKAIAPLA